jgi:hypothetical protein
VERFYQPSLGIMFLLVSHARSHSECKYHSPAKGVSIKDLGL